MPAHLSQLHLRPKGKCDAGRHRGPVSGGSREPPRESVCARTPPALNAEGKIQLLVCLGGFGTSVATLARSEKESLSCLKRTAS